MIQYAKYLFGTHKVVMTPDQSNGEAVVLVHGLIHRSWTMLKLGRELRDRGYTVFIFDYRTTRARLAKHAALFRDYFLEVAETFQGKKIHIINHSMGGLVTRLGLGNDGLLPPERRGKIIYLAVPHGGSPVAARWLRRLPGLAQFLVRSLTDLSDRNDALGELPEPDWDSVSIIARFDRKVPFESTVYRRESERRIVDAGHAFLMDHPEARREIRAFLE